MKREEMKRITGGFVDEIMACDSVAEARKIYKKVKMFFMKYDVPDDCNEILISGVGEMLHMMCGYTYEEELKLIRQWSL